MALFDFRRCDGMVGMVPQKFIDNKLKQCPLCGTDNPYWTLKPNTSFFDKKVQFKCKDCGCILSANPYDLSDKPERRAASSSTVDLTLNTIEVMQDNIDIINNYNPDNINNVMMKILNLGSSNAPTELLNRQLSIEELQKLNIKGLEKQTDRMIYCSNCGSKVKYKNNFCQNCGNKIEK